MGIATEPDTADLCKGIYAKQCLCPLSASPTRTPTYRPTMSSVDSLNSMVRSSVNNFEKYSEMQAAAQQQDKINSERRMPAIVLKLLTAKTRKMLQVSQSSRDKLAAASASVSAASAAAEAEAYNNNRGDHSVSDRILQRYKDKEAWQRTAAARLCAGTVKSACTGVLGKYTHMRMNALYRVTVIKMYW